jgi:uncharacterized membrane protein YoaK (UPF0700 family)
MPYRDNDRIKRYAGVDPLILLGGVVLTFIAGFVNTISLHYFHVPVSHMSGVVTKLSIDLASQDYKEFANLIYIFLGFFSGAILSGYVIGVRNIKPTHEYSFILFGEFVALLLSILLFRNGMNLGLSLVAFACGMQNAMASNYLGLIIRTTHVTGIVTDLGFLLGQSLKHRHIKTWKMFFLASLLAGFFLGGFFALISFKYFHFYALLIPAGFCLIASFAFYVLRVKPRT